MSFFTHNTLVNVRDSGCCAGGIVGCCPCCNEMSTCAVNMYVALSSEFLRNFIGQKYQFVLNKKSIFKLD